jgi:hypothetical protein
MPSNVHIAPPAIGRGVVAALAAAAAAVLFSCGGTSETGSTTGPTHPFVGGKSRVRTASGAAPAGRSGGIRSFGQQADRRQRAAVSAAVRGYTGALAADDGAVACSHLAAALQAQALKAAEGERRGSGTDCSRLLKSLFSGQARDTRAALRSIVISDVRVEGFRAFAVIREPGMPTEFFPLRLEHSQWKVAALGGSTLP